ncbi:MAG: hypothetical protein Q9227_004077 [Pyrenula ochraceoflavens]
MTLDYKNRSNGSSSQAEVIDLENEAESLLSQFLAGSSSNDRGSQAQNSILGYNSLSSKDASTGKGSTQPNIKIKRSSRPKQGSHHGSARSEHIQIPIMSESDLAERHDALRARLISVGVWYEEVDELIRFCAADSHEYHNFQNDPDMILSSPGTSPLTLEKASELNTGLGIVEGWQRPKRGRPENSALRKSSNELRELSRPHVTSVPASNRFQPSSDIFLKYPAGPTCRPNQRHQRPGIDVQSTEGRTKSRPQLNQQSGTCPANSYGKSSLHQTPRSRSSSRSSSPSHSYQYSRLNRIHAQPHIRVEKQYSSPLIEAKSAYRNDLAPYPSQPSKAKHFPEPKISTVDTLSAFRQGERDAWRFKTKSAKRRLFDSVHSDLRKWKSWTGASHDVINVSWSPDGTRYVAGSAGLEDQHTMQYNRRNNLLLGSLVTNSIRSLPDHRKPRPLPSNVDSGPNSLDATYSTSEPWLYTTITALGWSQQSDRLFTASYDRTAKIWDTGTSSREPCLVSNLKHKARVEAMAVSGHHRSLLATCTNRGDRSLRLYNFNEDYTTSSYVALGVTDTEDRQPFNFAPGSLQFGISKASLNHLVAGFASEEKQDFAPSSLGYLALYRISESGVIREKVQPYKQNIFDVAWSPNSAYFATGNAAPLLERKRGKVNSQVRVYDISQLPSRFIEYDCPARDINEVTFCDYDNNYVTASCTDGSTYVWDFRRPDRILHRLQHGKPMSELLHDRPRELSDVGVRAAQWGTHTHQLYTGASDGVLKLWDIRRSPEDVLIKDVARFNAEIMCAKFSADKTNLVIGDGQGSIHLLTTAPLDGAEEIGEIHLEPETNLENKAAQTQDSIEPWTEGRRAAQDLLSTQQITLDPKYGAGKGPQYHGPYARWARPGTTGGQGLSTTSLLPEIQALQLDQTRWNAKRSREPVISSEGTMVIDLEGSDEEEEPSQVDQETTQKRRKEESCLLSPTTKLDLPNATITETLSTTPAAESDQHPSEQDNDPDDSSSDDFWFPPPHSYSANLVNDSA